MSTVSQNSDAPGPQQRLEEALLEADRLRIAGQWTKALALLTAVRPIVGELGLAARAKHALFTARVLIDQGGFGGFDTRSEQWQYLDMALADAQQTNDLSLLGAIWDARGMSLHHQFLDTGRTAEPPEELPSFERGLTYRQQADDQHGIAESLFHIGLIYGIVRQDHQKALPFLQQSYTLAQTLGDHITASYAIRHMGFAQYDAGNLIQALENLQESLQLREQAEFIPGVAMALVMLAYANAELKQHALALEHLHRAKAIFQELDAAKRVGWVEGLITEFQKQAAS
jgi:tetratricopeptide (TPR) repeat protein